MRAVGAPFDSTFRLDPQAIWLAPLANLPLFALAVAIAVLVVPAAARRGTAVGTALALAVLEVGLVSARVHPLATTPLAIGGATQATRFLLARVTRPMALIRASALVLALASTAGALGWNTTAVQRERALRASRPAPCPGAPNVVLLVLDTERASSLGAYGAARATTPRLSRLADDGIRFRRAMRTAPWTLPSHVSLLTGRYPHQVSAGWNAALDGHVPVLGERLRAQGYATGAFVGNLVFLRADYGLARGFERYVDHPLDVDGALATSTLWRGMARLASRASGRLLEVGRKPAVQVNREFLRWREGVGGRPYFALLNYFDAHAPYNPPTPHDTLFTPRQALVHELPHVAPPDPHVVRGLADAYDASLHAVDAAMGDLLDALDRRGDLANTIVIVTADHGESFGEHGYLAHGGGVEFPTQLHAPLVVHRPRGAPTGRVIDAAVTLRDVPATVLDLVGAPADLPGRSLRPHWAPDGQPGCAIGSPLYAGVRTRPAIPDWYPLARGTLRTLVRGPWQYIVRHDGRVWLYDLSTDPAARADLASAPAHAAALDSMRAALTRVEAPGVEATAECPPRLSARAAAAPPAAPAPSGRPPSPASTPATPGSSPPR